MTEAAPMPDTALIDWTHAPPNALGRGQGLFHHDLANHPAFSDEGLEQLIDQYPFEAMELFTMGYNPLGQVRDGGQDGTAPRQWYLGRVADKPDARPKARDLMAGVAAGRLWLNLRKCNLHVASMDRLCRDWFAEIAAYTGLQTFRHDLGLLVSSPRAHVFYHLDMALVMLVQVRGIKRVHLYPPHAPYIEDADLEAIALRANDEQLRLDPDWDRDALIHDLQPGEAIYWPQNAPHRIVNADCLNVSLSIEYMTPAAAWRANLIYANGCLRRYMGIDPNLARSPRALEPFKIAYGRLIKALGGYRGHTSLPQPCFSLTEPRTGKIVFDAGIAPPLP